MCSTVTEGIHETHLPDSSIQPSLNEDLEPTGPQRLFQILVRVIGVTVAPNNYSHQCVMQCMYVRQYTEPTRA
eukprot:COSAG06_NODE_5092_length_3725_cov_1.932708_3_plen_73_part_00